MAIDKTMSTSSTQPQVDDVDSSANDSEFITRLAAVRLLTLAEGAAPVLRSSEERKTDELWRGEGHDHLSPESPPIPIYLRACNAVPLVAELVCGVIARQLNLPAPEVFAVLVEQDALPKSKFLNPLKRHLCVGTRDVGGNTFSQLMNGRSDYAMKMLKSWEHLLPVTVLDEWLANPDRNMDNILYVAQTLHIIDHAEAFGGSERELFPLADLTEETFTNNLAKFLPSGTPGERQSLLNRAQEWLTFTAGRMDVTNTVASAEIQRWQSSEEEAELVNFITNRLTITHRLLCSRLGHPQLNLSS